MDLNTIITTFRVMPFNKRLLLMAAIGILPSLWSLLDEGQTLKDDIEITTSARDQAETKFKNALGRKANLPKLEEQLAYSEGELATASKKLPDEFIIEKILQKTAMIAEDMDVELKLFDPGQGVPSGSVFKYVEMPIALNVIGTYSQIASFFDRIVHLELLVHIKNMTLELHHGPAQDNGDTQNSDDAQNAKTSHDDLKAMQQRKTRENLKLLASAEMVIFRTMTKEEEASIAIATKEQNDKQKGKKKPGSKNSDE